MASSSGNRWRFGNKAGLNFNTLNINGDPTLDISSPMLSYEGCTTISDDSGNILFYSNGINLWDANDVLIANDLQGSSTSDASCLVTKVPGTTNDYYLFTISDLGLHYNLKYNRLRNVTTVGLTLSPAEKNLPLYPNPADSSQDVVAESLQAFKNTDGSYWIITIQPSSSSTTNIVAIKLNTNNTFGSPVLSNIPTPRSVFTAGQLRINTAGTKLAKATFAGNWWLYDFDSTTGIVSNPLQLRFSGVLSCGAEFSPNGNLVYISDAGGFATIYQYDITSGNTTLINNSQTLIGGSLGLVTGKLQIATNGRIYAALSIGIDTIASGPNYIGVITNPNIPGTGCSYNDNVLLDSRSKGTYSSPNNTQISTLSLPSFEKSISVPPVDPCAGFTAPTIVKNGNILSVPNTYSSYQWQLNNANIPNAISNSYSPAISGAYTVTVTSSTPCTATTNPYVIVVGCSDPLATNYNSSVNIDNNTCTYSISTIPLAPICDNTKTQALDLLLDQANCKFSDMISCYLDKLRKGFKCEKDIKNIEEIGLLLKVLNPYRYIGSTEVQAQGSKLTFDLENVNISMPITILIKDGINNVALYTINITSIDPTIASNEVVNYINYRSSIFGFIATIDINNNITIISPSYYGINSNGLTITTENSGSPIPIFTDYSNNKVIGLLSSNPPILVSSPFSGFNNAVSFNGQDLSINTQSVKLKDYILDISNGPFTLEAKIRVVNPNTGIKQTILSLWDGSTNSSFFWGVSINDQHSLTWIDSLGSTHTLQGTPFFNNNTNYDVAIVYDGTTTLDLYVNGNIQNGTSTAFSNFFNRSIPIYIGRVEDDGSGNKLPFNGIIEELRVSNIKRYSTSSYTPSTSPFTNDNNTILLYHFDQIDTFGMSTYTMEGGSNETCSISACLTDTDIDNLTNKLRDLVDLCGDCNSNIDDSEEFLQDPDNDFLIV